MINKFQIVGLRVNSYTTFAQIKNMDHQKMYEINIPNSIFFKDEIEDIKLEIEDVLPDELIFECESVDFKTLKEKVCECLRDYLYNR